MENKRAGLDSVGVVIKVKCEGYKNVSVPHPSELLSVQMQ